MHKNIIILAAGTSSRMKKETEVEGLSQKEIEEANKKSKGLISLNKGRPLLDYLLYNIKKAGYTDVYIVVGKNADEFKKLYGNKKTNNDFSGLNISFATQYIPEDRVKPLGTSDAILQTLKQYPHLQKEQFTLCNSDNLYSEEALRKLRETPNANAFIAYDRNTLEFPKERMEAFAISTLDKDNYLTKIIEKPSLEDIEANKDKQGVFRISMNTFKLDGNMILPYLENCPMHPQRKEKELPTAIFKMINDSPKAMIGIPMAEHVPDLTSKQDISTVKEYIKKNYINI